MLNDPNASEVKALVVEKRPLELVFSEDGAAALRLVMPPYEDLAEVEALRETHFSIQEYSEATKAPLQSSFNVEYERLGRMYERFGESPTYLNRLANFAAIIGQFEREREHLKAALALTGDDFLRNRLVDNMISRHDSAGAETLLRGMDLGKNLYANLRLAALHAVRGEHENASRHVAKALDIDPMDFGARLFDGALRLWQGDNERAIVSFRIASERRPNSASSQTNLAVAYVRTRKTERALQCLKVAVAIDPLNLNATAFLADVAHSLSRDEDAIPSLRFALRYEQKQPDLWGRLARALLSLNQVGEAIAAIKRQTSIENESGPWNNLGVAYHRRGDDSRALESFKHAITLAKRTDDYGFCLAAKNAAVIISKSRKPDEVIGFIDGIVRPENKALFASRPDLCGIFAIKIRQLARLRRYSEAARLGEELISWNTSDAELIDRVGVSLLALYALQDGGAKRAFELAPFFLSRALMRAADDEVRGQLLNNVAFLYAEHGQLGQADRCLQLISDDIHKKAYPTATLGLVHLKRGRHRRAEDLYSEALRLAVNPEDKARIRQKWNLELGRALLNIEPNRARRLLTRAQKESEGEEALAQQAKNLLRMVP